MPTPKLAVLPCGLAIIDSLAFQLIALILLSMINEMTVD